MDWIYDLKVESVASAMSLTVRRRAYRYGLNRTHYGNCTIDSRSVYRMARDTYLLAQRHARAEKIVQQAFFGIASGDLRRQ